MHIQLIDETSIQLSSLTAEEFSVGQEIEALYFGAMQMFVASLGRCTFAVLADYSMRLDVPVDDIVINLDWNYAYKPTRISHINMIIVWQNLPQSRLKAVQRVSGLCTIHNTIHDCIDVVTKVVIET